MKKVLLVGHCNFDYPRIAKLIEDNFDASVFRAGIKNEAVDILTQDSFDIAIINRLDAFDGSSGIDLIKQIKGDGHLTLPLMLITNYEDSMDEAMKAGAVEGFGKLALEDNPQEIIEILSQYL